MNPEVLVLKAQALPMVPGLLFPVTPQPLSAYGTNQNASSQPDSTRMPLGSGQGWEHSLHLDPFKTSLKLYNLKKNFFFSQRHSEADPEESTKCNLTETSPNCSILHQHRPPTHSFLVQGLAGPGISGLWR